MATETSARRGFASMDSEKQREIARKGGRAAHEKGTAHEFTADEARAAGRKGGERVSANRDHMSRIGRLGGKRSAGRRQSMKDDQGFSDERSSGGAEHPGDRAATDKSVESPAGMVEQNVESGQGQQAASQPSDEMRQPGFDL